MTDQRSLLSIYAATFLVVMSQGLVIPLLPEIVQRSSELPPTTGVAVAVATFGVARLVMNIPAAHIVQRFGGRSALAGGASMASVGMFVLAYAPSTEILLVSRILSGIGSAVFIVSSLAYVLARAPAGTEGRVIGAWRSAFVGGVSVGPALGGVLGGNYGVHAPLLVVGVAAGMSAVIAVTQMGSGAPATPAPTDSHRAPWHQPAFWAIGLVSFLIFATRNGTVHTVVPVALTQSGVSIELLGFALSLSAAATIVAGPLAGQLVDRVGSWKPMLASLPLLGLAVSTFAFTGTWEVAIVVAMLLYGAALGLADASSLTAAHGLSSASSAASSVGHYRTFGDLGYIVGPLAFGGLAAALSPTAAILTNVGVLVFAFVSLAVLSRRTAGR